MRILMAGLLAAATLSPPAMAQDTAPLSPPLSPPPAPPPKSEACQLLTSDQAKEILGHAVMNGDDSPESGGMASCGWVDEETFAAIVFIVSSGVALGDEDPVSIVENTKAAQAATGTLEDVPDLGDRAILLTSAGTSGDSLGLSLSFAKAGKVVVINSTGVPKEGMMQAAKVIAGNVR